MVACRLGRLSFEIASTLDGDGIAFAVGCRDSNVGHPTGHDLLHWLRKLTATGPGRLVAGSDPRDLPRPLLISDEQNNRLLIIDPNGRTMWEFPRPGDLTAGQTFKTPDDAYFTPNGKQIIATQGDDNAISVIDVATRKIVYTYGESGVAGSGPNK